MSYQRVLPRDLFNEAKLLKCMGRLALLMHDGKLGRWPHLRMEHRDEEYRGFDIDQDPSDGSLLIKNVVLRHGDTFITLGTIYNSRAEWPLIYRGQDEEGFVFDDKGNLTPEFARWLDRHCSPAS